MQFHHELLSGLGFRMHTQFLALTEPQVERMASSGWLLATVVNKSYPIASSAAADG
jgi:hypothetical protein